MFVNNKHVITVRFCVSMINKFKNRFVVGHVLLSMFNHYNKICLEINIIV